MATKDVVTTYLKKLADVSVDQREDLLESIKIKNYGSNELSETDMWILSMAADNAEYLNGKLKEELSLDSEAPSEEELSLDDTPTEGGEELSLDGGEEELSLDDTPDPEGELSLDDAPADDMGEEELSLDEPAEGGEELSLDDAPADDMGEEELSLDEPAEGGEESEEEDKKIETSLAGVGILPLIAEIQEKLANGKPSEVELAALKAMKKLF